MLPTIGIVMLRSVWVIGRAEYLEANVIDINFLYVSMEMSEIYKDACKIGFEYGNDLLIIELLVDDFSYPELILQPATAASMKNQIEHNLIGTISLLFDLIVLLQRANGRIRDFRSNLPTVHFYIPHYHINLTIFTHGHLQKRLFLRIK